MFFKYNVFGPHLSYNAKDNILRPNSSGNLSRIKFQGVSNLNEIKTIHLTSINLLTDDPSNTNVVIKEGLILEVYSQQN